MLQKAELGWHAFEERMPTRLRVELEKENRTTEGRSERVIEVLGRLCDQDESVEAAYLCHPAVQLITKTPKEGNLCGYRNIQMVISYIASAKVQESPQFANGVPSVLRLQDLIEDAWDKGVNREGRFETGGIRGTRKYIGTPEVCGRTPTMLSALHNAKLQQCQGNRIEALLFFPNFPPRLPCHVSVAKQSPGF
jgi:hypothetical protein